MSMKHRRWCPSGCGKSVTYEKYKTIRGVKRIHYCSRCEGRFSKEEMEI